MHIFKSYELNLTYNLVIFPLNTNNLMIINLETNHKLLKIPFN